jgi:hypothetical protein
MFFEWRGNDRNQTANGQVGKPTLRQVEIRAVTVRERDCQVTFSNVGNDPCTQRAGQRTQCRRRSHVAGRLPLRRPGPARSQIATGQIGVREIAAGEVTKDTI